MSSWYKIRLDPADVAFSKFIRLRDKRCVHPTCTRVGEPDAKGFPIKGLQASHFHSRRKESTRYDEENVDALCAFHHDLWAGGNRNIDYRAFKLSQLGQERLDLLDFRAEQYCKKDRKMRLIEAKELMKTL